MQQFKIQIKLGEFEFSAEGEEKTVNSQLSSFMEFVNKSPQVVVAPPLPQKVKMSVSEEKIQADDHDATTKVPILPAALTQDLEKIFIRERDKLSLRIHPAADERLEIGRKSTVLILHGLKTLYGKGDVGVTAIADALRASGVKFYRIGEMLDPLYKEGIVNRTGKFKGVQYSLTNKGVIHAEQIIEELRPRF